MKRFENSKKLKEEFYTQNRLLEDQKRRNKEMLSNQSKLSELEELQRLNEIMNRDALDKKTKKDNMLNKVKDDLLRQIEEKRLAKEKQNELDKTPIPEYKDPHVYNCEHGSNMHPCSICNKSFPIKLLTKRSKSQNVVRRKKQFK